MAHFPEFTVNVLKCVIIIIIIIIIIGEIIKHLAKAQSNFSQQARFEHRRVPCYVVGTIKLCNSDAGLKLVSWVQVHYKPKGRENVG